MRYSEILCEARPNPMENPAFRLWFGHSKIVYDDGEPMVVYHGTDANFAAFNLERATSEGSAIFFSRNPDFKRGWDSKSAGGYGNTVMPVYLNIENPHVTGFTEKLPPESDEATVAAWMQRQERFDRQFDNDRYKRNYYQGEIRYARHHGHDGVIIHQITDDRYHHPIRSMPSDVFVVFSPNQIKSAIGNRGTYSSDDPDITEGRN